MPAHDNDSKLLVPFALLLTFASGVQAATTFESSCLALLKFSPSSGKVTAAQPIAAGRENNQAIPAHCKLQGELNRHQGIDGKSYAIGFELRLPQDWNGKFFFQGGGGTDGVLRPALGAHPGAALRSNALSLGFAVVSTDAGHLNEPGIDGSYLFGADPQARIDYGYGHLLPVTTAAKQTIKKLYGKSPSRSYFVGCSNGGRQGMMATQRYPQLFDGVIAGAPAYRVIDASVEAMAQTQVFASVAPVGNDGRPQLGSALTAAELKTIGNGILTACDKQDGIEDQMVGDTRQCNFDPMALQCAGASAQECLAPAKAAALKKVFQGARDSTGKILYSRWPYDPGINAPNWTVWKFGPATASPPQAINTTLVAGALSHVFATPPVMTDDLFGYALKFDLDKDPGSTAKAIGPFKQPATKMMNADSIDIDAFQKRGGKLLLYHGMADAIFSAYDTADYLGKLEARYGKRTDDLARLFLVPGMGHCGGGPATDQFDALQALVDWVENGRAPETIVAKAGAATPWPNRTRPLCAYPKKAIYNGSGNSEDAASFTCKE